MSGECDDELDIDSKGGTLPTKVVKYEQFLNDTLRGDLKYVNRGSMYGIFRNRPESPELILESNLADVIHKT